MGKRKSSTPVDPPIQFRPGKSLLGLIEEYAQRWQLSPNETAKHLVALAISGFDVRHRELVEELRQRMYGAPDFFEACQRLAVELQGYETGREKRMTEDERSEAIEKIVRHYVLLHRDPENPTEERAVVRIYHSE